ncbi:acetoin utilization AcuB family protein [Salirhabdus salicampi]|uniref:acetoin utilization AcuB family protein n=1 Tax=Salirhabdus salicampi TaxID=476102 RepID=UPI0020C406EE|nr:acetoin utilization AcuB family protein [Salirhabdus salicampi]MCP8617140.1 acetoin utilization AcuB family protein [Salirhabdus salicampi]
MLVEEIMNMEAISLPPNETIETALYLLRQHDIHHIPIVNDKKEVIGIVSDRDIRDARPSTLHPSEQNTLQYKLHTIMTKPVVTVHPLDFVEEVASIFYEKEISCVPVTKQNKLVGMVTEKDVLYTLIQLTGIHEVSSQIEVKVKHKIGVLPEISKIISEHNVNISSVLVYPDRKESTSKVLVFRINTLNPLPVIQDLKQKGYEVLWPNLPGVTK